MLIISIGLLAFPVNGQEFIDDPNLDQIPQWYLDQIQKMPRQNSQVITINDFDNFYLGVDFAEGHISANPLQPEEFFCAFNTDDSHYTMDGHNWVDSNPVWGIGMRGDPVTAYDGDGNLYYENMYGSPNIQGCKVVVSNDNGQTWGTAVNAISGNDKNWIAADQTDGPYANYVYTTMTNSGTGRFSRSTDQGQTWQSTFNPSTQSLPGMMVCVGANGSTQGGSVFVVTNSGSSFSSTYTFYESNDGGATFTYQSAQNFAGYVGTNVSGRNSVQNMRTRPYPFITADNSYGPNRGRLHLVYATNDPPGDGNKPDIFSRYSDDGGTTWSNAKKVNTGFLPQNSHQWAPATWCDKETGRLYVQWMDSRDTPANDSALIYATYSDDGGETFKISQKISNEKMKINCTSCGGGGTPRYQGDYNAIVSNSDVSCATWADFRWGNYASFTTYFPDFAMRVYPIVKQISYQGTIWAVIPDTKLYDNDAIFSASIETPPSGTFTIGFPMGNTISSFPDSIPISITADQVPVGEYAITIKGEGPNGTPVHYRDAVIDVIPLAAPVAEFTVSDSMVCEGSGTNFTDESINGPSSWLWTFEGGNPETSTEQNPSGVIYNTNGVFDVTLEVTNSTGSNQITKSDFITVNTLPIPPLGESVAVCINVVIPPLVAEGTNVLWYSNPELTELVFSGNIFYTENTLPGNYTYYATQTSDGCESEAIEITLMIYDTPGVSFMELDTVCFNEEVFELSGGSPEGGEYFGPGVLYGAFNASEAGEGTHTLGYEFTNENLCTDTAYQNITVRQLSSVTFDPLPSVCANAESFELIGGLPTGGTYSGDGVVNNMFYPETTGHGDHDITYTITDVYQCSNSASQTLIVFELPHVNIGNDTTICGSESITLNATITNASSYLWSPGDFTTPSIIVDSTEIGYGSEEYMVLVTDNNNCSVADGIVLTFINCTGINEIVGMENVSIYPNPNEGAFNLNITSSRSITLNLKVQDASGKLYREQKQLVIDGQYSTNIKLVDAQPGLYFITLENNEGIYIKKILVK